MSTNPTHMKPKLKKQPKTAIMLFHGFGCTSEEEHDIVGVKNGIVTLDTNEEPCKRFRFDQKTGRCLNDVTDFGCWRTLKL